MESSLVPVLSFWFYYLFFVILLLLFGGGKAVGGHDLSGTMIDLKRLGLDTLGLD
jgi:hypothetical protein